MSRHNADATPSKPQNVKEDHSLEPWQIFLPKKLILKWCNDAGYRFRDRCWNPVQTLWSCVRKQAASISARQVEDRQTLDRDDNTLPQRRGSAFCAARSRLPLAIFQKACDHVGEQASAKKAQFFGALRVAIFDGSSSTLPRTEANKAAFHVPENQHGPCPFPLLRWVLLICAGCGAVLKLACGDYNSGELLHWLDIVNTLPAKLLCVGDRLFGNYVSLARTQARGSHVLARLHVNRRANAVRTLGRHDEIHLWQRPRPEHLCDPKLWPELPQTMEVRILTYMICRKGFRDLKLVLVTTLLDHKAYPSEQLAQLYCQRWNIEVQIRTLKAAHGLDRLSAKTPENVRREFYAGILADNGVRATLAEGKGNPSRLSHTRALEFMLVSAERMSAATPAKRRQLLQKVFALVAQMHAPAQKRPPEPIAVVQRRCRYPILSTSRAAFHRKHPAA